MLLRSAVLFLIVGVASAIVQSRYFGYVDADGVLHDSIFLPISVLSLGVAALLFAVWALVRLMRLLRQDS